MDKFSKKTLTNDVTKTVKSAHLGTLNGVENVQVKVSIERSKIKLEPNVMVFQAFAFLAATKLKDSSNRVLMLLFSKSGYENYVSMDVSTIAESLKYTERSVIMALNELTDNNIVIKVKHPSDKRRHDYFINPIAAWRGNSYTRKKMIGSIDTAQIALFQSNSLPEH